MKNKLTILLLSLIIFSCTVNNVEDRPIIEALDASIILAPDSGNTYELSFENKDVQAERFVWSAANYAGDVQITYNLYIDIAGGDFSEAKILGGTNSQTFLSVSQESLNNIALEFGAAPFVAASFDVKLVSDIADLEMMDSNTITITVIPYTTESPKIYVVGSFQGASGYGNDWTPADGVALAASDFGETDFEGYVYMNVASPEFVFLPTTNGWDGKYGDDGSFSGLLALDGGNIQNSTGGYFLVKANTTTLSYSLDAYDWAVTGSATPNGWPDNGVQDHDMTYNKETKTWEVTLDLTGGGEIKFRANDGWDWNYGDDGADGTLENGAANIAVAEDGNYTIALDLSTPREYTYSVTKN